jgi:hypothetical protein
MLDVPGQLVGYLARLLAAERRAARTRRGTRRLSCRRQALMVLVWFRKNDDIALLGEGFGISRATACRYVAEAVRVLASQAPDLHEALERVAADGFSHVILDGKVFATDRADEQVISVKGEPVDAWYSGKHHHSGANIQAVMRPDGLPIWISDGLPGHLHDLTCARRLDIDGALYWAASRLRLPTLADSGYQGCGIGIWTPFKQPSDGRNLGVDNRAYNQLLRATRCLGERGFALLTGRWRNVRHITASPSLAGNIVRAVLVLTHFEYKYLPNPC